MQCSLRESIGRVKNERTHGNGRIRMNKKLLTRLMALMALLSALSPQPSTFAQGTAFSYQGQLKDNGNPANGSYDISFAVYDAVTNGNLIGASVTNSAVDVSNGLFSTSVDLSGIFTGNDLWLEIAVSTNGANTFSVIAPRQLITPTPYALYAKAAGTAAGATPGTLVTSLNTLKDDITLAAGTNVVITPDGNTLTISSAGAGGNGIWAVSGNNAFYTAGRVGIGTNSPKGALHVASGGVAVTGASSPYTGAGPGVFLESFGVTGGLLFAFDYGVNVPLNLLLNSPGGNVGIGTLSPAAKLTVYDPASVSHRVETGGGINAWARVELANANGQWNVGTSRGYNGDSLNFNREGVAASALALQPNGDATFGGNVTLSGSAAVSHRIQTSGGVNAWTRIELANANGQWNVGTSRGYNGDQLYFNRQGDTANALALQPNGDAAFIGNVTVGSSATINGTAYVGGNASVCTLTIRGGCDLAEPFATTEPEVEKGSVVVIDPEHPGKLKLSDTAYDTRVAGVVSGANGINPGIALHQEGALEGGQNVALTGRVYVLADAIPGAIRPGDLLTTSDTPGHAMKANDHAKAQGAILGKAMSSLKEGKGMVLVLVTLQ